MDRFDAQATEPPAGDGAAPPPTGGDADAGAGPTAPPSAPRGPAGRLRAAAAWLRARPKHAAGAAGVVILVVGAAVAAGLGVGAPAAGDSETVELAAGFVFHPLPTLLTDVRPGRERPHYIKLDVVLEVGADVVPVISLREAAIIDAMRSVLRDYDHSDLIGTAGADRVRRDLIAVVNRELEPARARSVLFTQFVLD